MAIELRPVSREVIEHCRACDCACRAAWHLVIGERIRTVLCQGCLEKLGAAAWEVVG